MKSAVSILHDFLNRTEIKAVYELRSENVTKRAVLFYYHLRVGNLEATATGFSKKQAKQNVSEKMLDMLHQKSPRSSKSISKNQQKYFDDLIKLHPAQSLYDICMTNHWYFPTYEYVTQEGPANDRTFTCVAKIDDIEEKGIGIGKSKKSSKANAAYNLVEKLNSQNEDSSHHRVPHSYVNYTTALCDMADSNGLRLNCFHFPDRGSSAQKQCLLEVLSIPVIVCCGFGETMESALDDASMNAINSLKIVVAQYCKK